jgi:hypothetical protein
MRKATVSPLAEMEEPESSTEGGRAMEDMNGTTSVAESETMNIAI